MTNLSKSHYIPKRKYDKVVQIRMTEDYYEYLKFTSQKLNISISKIIREALFLYLSNHI